MPALSCFCGTNFQSQITAGPAGLQEITASRGQNRLRLQGPQNVQHRARGAWLERPVLGGPSARWGLRKASIRPPPLPLSPPPPPPPGNPPLFALRVPLRLVYLPPTARSGSSLPIPRERRTGGRVFQEVRLVLDTFLFRGWGLDCTVFALRLAGRAGVPPRRWARSGRDQKPRLHDGGVTIVWACHSAMAPGKSGTYGAQVS